MQFLETSVDNLNSTVSQLQANINLGIVEVNTRIDDLTNDITQQYKEIMKHLNL